MAIYNGLVNVSKKFLIGGVLLASLLIGGKKAKAEDSLEGKVLEPKTSVTFNYKTESERKGVDYSTSKARFYRDSGILDYYPNILGLNSAEKIQVEHIINDIKLQNIDSYQSFIKVAEDLSENQKLVLLGAIGGLLSKFNYDHSYPEYEVASQVVFFNKLQDSLESGSQNNLGVCRHIHSHIEQLANDLGMGAAAVTGVSGGGIGHVYSIVNTRDGSAIIDYGDILITNTNNIEKTLEAYQKWRGTTTFGHEFYEDTKFKYRLMTRDGRHFLDFIGYDESLGLLKDALIENTDRNSEVAVILNQGDYSNSVEFDYQNFFVKVGDIKGDSSSPMDKMELLQTGYKGTFSISDTINVNGNLSLICGRFYQDKELENNEAIGMTGNLIASPNNEDAFNFGLKVAGGIFLNGSNIFAYDFTTGVGTSYKFKTEKLSISPHIAIQYSLFPKEIGSCELGVMFSELGVGTLFDIKTSGDTKLLIEPYFTKRMWEDEFGANMRIGSRKLKFNFGGYTTTSNYEFCPHKKGFDAGLCATLKNLEIGVGYKREEVDYSGDKENQESLEFGVCAKF